MLMLPKLWCQKLPLAILLLQQGRPALQHQHLTGLPPIDDIVKATKLEPPGHRHSNAGDPRKGHDHVSQ